MNTTVTNIESIAFTTEDFQELTDELLDRLRVEAYTNPIVDFLVKRSGYLRKDVEDAFRFIRFFGRYSGMPFSRLLQNSKPDFTFWWDLFILYDEDKLDSGCTEMLKKLHTLN